MSNFRARHALRLLLLLSCVIGLAACNRPAIERQEAYVFGTRVEVVSYGVPTAQAQAALSAVLQEFDRIHREYHAWQPSALTQANEACASGKPVTVSVELAGLVRSAQSYSRASDGLFDPGIGQIIALWGFHSDKFVAQLPDRERLHALMKAHPGISAIRLEGSELACGNPAVTLDFGGIAKGWALDRAATILRERGVTNAIINIGGNIMALGKKGEVPWQVGLQDPRGNDALATLSLYDGEAVGTSGDYQRFFELDGRRYSHIIDPRTGEPAQGTQAVTVLIVPQKNHADETGLRSDVTSKPIFLAGKRWREMAMRMQVAHVLRIDADGHIEVTKDMQARLRWPATDGKRHLEVVN